MGADVIKTDDGEKEIFIVKPNDPAVVEEFGDKIFFVIDGLYLRSDIKRPPAVYEFLMPVAEQLVNLPAIRLFARWHALPPFPAICALIKPKPVQSHS